MTQLRRDISIIIIIIVIIIVIIVIIIITIIIIIILIIIITSLVEILYELYQTCQTSLMVTCIMCGHFSIVKNQLETRAHAAALFFWPHKLQLPNGSKQIFGFNPRILSRSDPMFPLALAEVIIDTCLILSHL